MNTHQKKQKELEDRTINFGVSVIRKCSLYSKTYELRPIIHQVVRSSTSVGANYAEANNASSKADFKNKIFIAKKEIAETRYWLRVFAELLPDEDFSNLSQEALELNLILQKIISTMNAGDKNGK